MLPFMINVVSILSLMITKSKYFFFKSNKYNAHHMKASERAQHMTIVRHLKTFGYVNPYKVWVNHNLTGKKKLIKRIYYVFEKNNCRQWKMVYLQQQQVPEENKSQSTSEEDGVIWWNWSSIIYYKLLQNNTLNLDKYYSQLVWLKAVIKGSWNWLIRKVSSSIRTIPDFTSFWRSSRN